MAAGARSDSWFGLSAAAGGVVAAAAFMLLHVAINKGGPAGLLYLVLCSIVAPVASLCAIGLGVASCVIERQWRRHVGIAAVVVGAGTIVGVVMALARLSGV